MKRRILAIFTFVLGILALWFILFGWTNRSSTRLRVVRLRYFAGSSTIVVNFEGTRQAFIMTNISGRNRADIEKWLSPTNVDVRLIEVTANSIYNRWADRTEDRDTIQFGVHGRTKGGVPPTFPNTDTVAQGIAPDDFPRDSFQLAADPSDSWQPPTFDLSITGNLVYSYYHHVSIFPEPHKTPGP